MAKDCQFKKKKPIESNVPTSSFIKKSKYDQNTKASFTVEEEELALTVTTTEQIDHKNDCIFYFDCSNHMTRDKQKLKNLSEYRTSQVVVTANNQKLQIAHIGKTIIMPQYNPNQVPLQQVYHVLSMKKNVLSMSIVSSSGHYFIFSLLDIKVYHDLNISKKSMIEG